MRSGKLSPCDSSVIPNNARAGSSGADSAVRESLVQAVLAARNMEAVKQFGNEVSEMTQGVLKNNNNG